MTFDFTQHHLHEHAHAELWRLRGGDSGDTSSRQEVKRKRRRTIASVAKEAEAANLTIVRIEFDRDGNISGGVTAKTLAAIGDNDDDAIRTDRIGTDD